MLGAFCCTGVALGGLQKAKWGSAGGSLTCYEGVCEAGKGRSVLCTRCGLYPTIPALPSMKWCPSLPRRRLLCRGKQVSKFPTWAHELIFAEQQCCGGFPAMKGLCVCVSVRDQGMCRCVCGQEKASVKQQPTAPVTPGL